MDDKDKDYEAKIDALIVEFTQNPAKFPTADDIVSSLDIGHPSNVRVMNAAKGLLKISFNAWRMATERHRKATEAMANKMDYEKRIEVAIGAIPADEREYVALFIDKKGYAMSYDGDFRQHGKPVPMTALSNDLVLTASSLALSRPKGKILTDARIDTALDEWMYIEREARRQELWESIKALPEGVDKTKIMFSVKTMCEWYFAEPEFAMAAIMKFIWQVKRKMLGLPIKEHHMVVIQGPQLVGKTEFCRTIAKPVRELFAETDASQVVDDRNFSLREQFVVFIDEMAKAEQTDVTKLKNIITGVDNISRVLYTHRTQKVTINMTLLGTSNPPLGNVVYDQTGMRRFIEIQPRPRSEVPEYKWKMIAEHDFITLWQAVDPYGPDPMEPFTQMLQAKQEQMRAKSNIEAWLEQFDATNIGGLDIADHRANHFAEFHSQPLYEIFRRYEERYHPASKGTSHTRWGSDLKALIQADKATGWSYLDKRPKGRYRLELCNVVDFNSKFRKETSKTNANSP